MSTSSNHKAGGNLTSREVLWYKAQVLAIAVMVLFGIARGYTIMVEEDQQALRVKSEEIEGRFSDCLKKHSVDEQASACKALAQEAEKAALESANISKTFPKRQLLSLFGSNAG